MAARFDWAVPTILGNADDPVLDTDVATKAYVDAAAGSGNSISNGNSAVAIATVDGNVTITANTTHAWVFDDSGNLTLPATGELVVTSGIVGSGASPAPYLSGFSSLGAVTVTATGNVAGGNLTTAGAVVATGNITGGNLNVTGNIVDTGALSIITGANGNISLSPNGTGIVTASGAFTATGNITGGNISTAGNLTLAGASSLRIPGGTAGDTLATDGNGNLTWLNLGAVTKLTSGTDTTGYSVSANSTIVLPWDIVTNDIGLVLAPQGQTQNAIIRNVSGRTLVLGVTWRVVWNIPTNPTGSRRVALRENSNNKDVQINAPVSGQPVIISSSTTIVVMPSGSGGIDFLCENYGSDQCGVGGDATPTGDYFFGPSNEATIVLLASY
jgi:hypothetical protein